MDANKVADAFNLWMDEYTNNPGAFEKTEASALNHFKDKLNGKEPSYGHNCSAVLLAYMEKI